MPIATITVASCYKVVLMAENDMPPSVSAIWVAVRSRSSVGSTQWVQWYSVYACDVVDVCTAVSGSAAAKVDDQLALKKRSLANDYYWQPGEADAAAKRAPSFRLGKRLDYADDAFDDLARRAPTFRLGKRAPSFRLGKRAPSFRLG